MLRDVNTIEESAEERLIARYFRPLAKHAGAFGLADDAAAIMPPAGCDLVVTTDGVIAGVHFLPDDAARDIGAQSVAHKSVRSCRQGRDVRSVFCFRWRCRPETTRPGSPASPPDSPKTANVTIVRSLAATPTTRVGPITASITAFGAVPHGKMVRRSTAKAGDTVVVTGTIGDAALGVKLRRERSVGKSLAALRSHGRASLAALSLPEPRNALAAAVLQYASAAMDISDGLAGDLAKLCRASSVAARIDVIRVPLSEAARTAIAAAPELLETVLTGGDDYEILLTLPPDRLPALSRGGGAAGVAGRPKSGGSRKARARVLHATANR